MKQTCEEITKNSFFQSVFLFNLSEVHNSNACFEKSVFHIIIKDSELLQSL